MAQCITNFPRGRRGRDRMVVEESPYVARIFSPPVIYENVDIVFIEIYRIR